MRTHARPGRRSHRWHALAAVAFAQALCGWGAVAMAQSPTRSVRARATDRDLEATHPVPRLKVSLVGFSVATPFGTSVPMTGVHAEMYPLSKRWMRGGVGMAGGRGRGAIAGSSATVQYGVLGASVGAQYPGRVTPFVEGHAAGGFMSASVDRPFVINGMQIDNAGGTTWLYTRGLDAGVEVYALGRAYVSGSIGWTRATWGSPDTRAYTPGTSSELRFDDVTSDSLMWKLGIGI